MPSSSLQSRDKTPSPFTIIRRGVAKAIFNSTKTKSNKTNTHIMDNRHHEAQNEWQLITDYWIELTLKKYHGWDSDDLTQVFMRGPFAGWSERMVLELALKLDDANNKLPRHKAQ